MASNYRNIKTRVLEKHKKRREVLSISEKVIILDLVRLNKKSYAEIAKMYNKNESSIRAIVRNEKRIRSSFVMAPNTAQIRSTVRDNMLIKVERTLDLWVGDMNRKGIFISGNDIRQEALRLYATYKKDTVKDNKLFTASKGWLHRFRNRHNLRNISKITTICSNDDIATAFSSELKKVTEDEGYHLKQVFSCDETFLFWKKMPSRVYINKNNNDRLSLIISGNAAGHIIKPSAVYRLSKAHVLQEIDNNDMPIFWQYDKNAQVTNEVFIEWFNHCFVPEVQEYLKQEGLPFKILLLIDNASHHPISIATENTNVKVMFIPPDITAFQPSEQGIFWFMKATYIRLVLEWIRERIDIYPTLDVIECWKSLTITDALQFVKTAIDELKSDIVSDCWKSLWSESAPHYNALYNEEEVKKITHAAKQIGREDFENIADSEVEEYIKDVCMENEIEENYISATEGDEEENEEEVEFGEDPLSSGTSQKVDGTNWRKTRGSCSRDINDQYGQITETKDDNEPLDNKIKYIQIKQEIIDHSIDDQANINKEFDDRLRKDTSIQQFTSDTLHPVQIFFNSMAATVITFPPELIIETRMKVCQLVSEMELQSLARQK